MKKLTLVIFILLSSISWAQDTLVDPLSNIKSFSTFEMGLYSHTTNINNVDFGSYTLPQGIYSPTIHSALFWHRVIMNQNIPEFKIKTGLLFNSNYTNLTDLQGKSYYFSQSEMALSFLFGSHIPIRYNTVNDKFYKAVDFSIGLYMGTPWFEYFVPEEDKYNKKGEYFNFNYVKFGIIADIELSMINKNGYGHRIGLRTMVDFNSIWKFKNSENGVYPCYTSFGIYYNLWTTDVTKANTK